MENRFSRIFNQKAGGCSLLRRTTTFPSSLTQLLSNMAFTVQQYTWYLAFDPQLPPLYASSFARACCWPSRWSKSRTWEFSCVFFRLDPPLFNNLLANYVSLVSGSWMIYVKMSISLVIYSSMSTQKKKNTLTY